MRINFNTNPIFDYDIIFSYDIKVYITRENSITTFCDLKYERKIMFYLFTYFCAKKT